MFDVGFSELVVIGLVALIVIGPERLPKVARTVGILLGRLQRYVSDVKADISREMQLDELKKLQEQMSNQARDLESSVSKEMRAVEETLQQETAPLQELAADRVPESGGAPATAPAPDAVAAPGAVHQLELGLDAQKTEGKTHV